MHVNPERRCRGILRHGLGVASCLRVKSYELAALRVSQTMFAESRCRSNAAAATVCQAKRHYRFGVSLLCLVGCAGFASARSARVVSCSLRLVMAIGGSVSQRAIIGELV